MSDTLPRSTGPGLVTTIKAGSRPGVRESAEEIVRHRDLLYFLVVRDIKARYAQTVLGFGWAIVQPIVTMGVFSIFFGGLADIPSEGVPYPLFSLAGLVPWTYFASSVGVGATSLIGNMSLITKVYMPRLLIPTGAVVGGLVNLAISFGVLLVVMAALGYYPPLDGVAWIPVLVILSFLAALAVSLWLAPLAVKFRDIRYATPFVVQTLLFATPVIYPLDLVPDRYRLFYSLNPMTGVVDGFRASLLDTGPIHLDSLGLSFLVSATLLFLGLKYFRRMEWTFADIS